MCTDILQTLGQQLKLFFKRIIEKRKNGII